MPSTLVHLGLAALVGTALLGDELDGWTATVVLVAAAVPDADALAGLVLPGVHRALLHTLLLPAGLAVAVAVDRRRTGSALVASLGPRGPRVAATAVVVLLVAGILPDLVTNGVNALYPLHDRFYTVDGELLLSTERGVVQTLVESDGPVRTTDNTGYSTPVDPEPRSPGVDRGAERVVPVVRSGTQLLLVVTGAAVLTARLYGGRRGRGG